MFVEKLQPKLGKGHFDIYGDKTRYKIETNLPNVTIYDSLKCAVNDCGELATKESVFDNKHKCTSTIVDCQAAALNLGGVCQSHKCAVVGCWYGARIVDGLCVKHKRRPDGTWDGVEPLGRVCKKHECVVDGCWYAARTLGGICDKYICGANSCHHDLMEVLPALKQMGVAIAVVFRCERKELNGTLQQIADETYTLYDITN
uniref:Uncharacterized protein n=1 Tax=Plectus sambesii TaxID=2011161 RepID=A0A914UMN6_9BILA